MKQTGVVVAAFDKGSTSLPEIKHQSTNEILQSWPIAQLEKIHPGCLSQPVPFALAA